MSQPTCETCRWWVRLNEGDLFDEESGCLTTDGRVHVGECRRFPPSVDYVELSRLANRRMASAGTANDGLANAHRNLATGFPITHDVTFCGEHTPREGKPE